MLKKIYQKTLKPAFFSLLVLAIAVSSCQDASDELNIQDIDQVALGQQEGIIPGKFIVVLH